MIDECVGPTGEWLPFGRCDECGSPCDEKGCDKPRLDYLRAEIRAERISYGELHELQGMADYIDRGDVELLEWAGVPEYDVT